MEKNNIMAKDKKSFILYADLLSVVEKLIIKDRENKTNLSGELFYHILLYVNDKNPIPIDFIIELAFEPIKASLKRDLKKYVVSVEEKSKGAKLGNLKRYKPDIYNKVITNELSLEEAENIAYRHIPSHTDTIQSDTVTSVAVNDNVIVNDNDNVIKYSKEGGVGEFLDDWNFLRKEILKKPSNFNRMTSTMTADFNEKSKQYTKIEFQNALKGLFKQVDIPKTVMTTSPKHFLENFETYLTAFYDDEYHLYSSDKNSPKSEPTVVSTGNR